MSIQLKSTVRDLLSRIPDKILVSSQKFLSDVLPRVFCPLSKMSRNNKTWLFTLPTKVQKLVLFNNSKAFRGLHFWSCFRMYTSVTGIVYIYNFNMIMSYSLMSSTHTTRPKIKTGNPSSIHHPTLTTSNKNLPPSYHLTNCTKSTHNSPK